jgi:hypothetical protein
MSYISLTPGMTSQEEAIPSLAATQMDRSLATHCEKSIVRSGMAGTVTVRSKVVVTSASPVAVPRTVTVDVDADALEPTASANVELAPVGAVGVNDAVTPAGSPSAANVTASSKLVREESIVTSAEEPRSIDIVAGVAVRVYDVAAVNTSVYVAELDTPDPLAVTVPG